FALRLRGRLRRRDELLLDDRLLAARALLLGVGEAPRLVRLLARFFRRPELLHLLLELGFGGLGLRLRLARGRLVLPRTRFGATRFLLLLANHDERRTGRGDERDQDHERGHDRAALAP